jgi:hypothetical protein
MIPSLKVSPLCALAGTAAAIAQSEKIAAQAALMGLVVVGGLVIASLQ